jgi:hypothetical protein
MANSFTSSIIRSQSEEMALRIIISMFLIGSWQLAVDVDGFFYDR